MAFLAGEMWDTLKRHGEMSCRDLAKMLDRERECVGASLKWLRDKGCAKASGNTWHRRWVAIGSRPVSMAGKAPGSAIGRALGAYMPKDMDALRKGFAAKVASGGWTRQAPKKQKRIQRKPSQSVYVGKIALEECWVLPTPSIVYTTTAPHLHNVDSFAHCADSHSQEPTVESAESSKLSEKRAA